MPAKQSIQTRVRTHLKLAKCWCATAVSDVSRRDRIDALDAIGAATRALKEARTELLSSLPLEARR